jgi:hypothetical protein
MDPSIGLSVDLPLVLELMVSCFSWAGGIHEPSVASSCS